MIELRKYLIFMYFVLRYSSIITSHMRGTPCMVPRMFLHVKFKKLLCVLLIPQDKTCHFPKQHVAICSKRVITRDVAVKVPISWGSMRISVGM